jgi:hypothetical protein
MKRLEVSCAVRPIYRSLGTKGLKSKFVPLKTTNTCVSGSRCTFILKVGTRWELMISFTLQLLYTLENRPCTH